MRKAIARALRSAADTIAPRKRRAFRDYKPKELEAAFGMVKTEQRTPPPAEFWQSYNAEWARDALELPDHLRR